MFTIADWTQRLTKPALRRRLKLRQFEGQRSALFCSATIFCARHTRRLGWSEGIVVRHDARNEYGSVAVSRRSWQELYYQEEPAPRSAAKLLARDEASSWCSFSCNKSVSISCGKSCGTS
jgi:hypothetical protein